ncbi:MAG TPA: hypothetical protein ENJ99_04465, partial [Rhizobiales bacterium]|nr:hypothetical protein [Hyphomicrobiales bacterium]
MPRIFVRLALETGFATSLFLPGFILGWGIYPPFRYTIILAMVVIVYLLVTKLIPKTLAGLLTIPVIALQIANIAAYSLFGIPFEYGALQVIINTDIAEAKEFFLTFNPLYWPALILPLLIWLAGLWWYLKSPLRFTGWRTKLSGAVMLALALPVLDHFHKPKYDIYSYIQVWRLAFRYSRWERQIDQSAARRAALFSHSNIFHKAALSPGNLDDIVVVVIGESLRRGHLGLYGYERNTTPELGKIRNRLIIFKRAISPANNTVNSIPLMLTPLTVTNRANMNETPSLAARARFSGYHTTWVSNTNLLGHHSSRITILARDSNALITTRPEGRIAAYYLHDEALLPYLDDLIRKSERKKQFIFLATRGSHAIYRKRYPERFGRFQPVIKGLSGYRPQLRQKIINAYDNSILYTDWLIAKFIARLKATGKPATLIYFSDHGERLFDDGKTIAHGGKPPVKIEYKVPFFIWRSKQRNCTSNLDAVTDKPVNMQYFYEIASFATCMSYRLPENLYSPKVFA